MKVLFMKYAAGITLYNPTNDEIENVIKYRDLFDLVIVYDNTDLIVKDYVDKIKSSHIIYLSENVNSGLPYAFNSIITHIKNFNIDVLCTLDQDSIFEAESIQSIKNYIEANPNFLDTVGVVAPFIEYHDAKIFTAHNKVINRDWVITSGAFLNLRLLKENNILYDNNYFLDRFEIDLCKQIVKKGYYVQMYCGAVLFQNLGYKGKTGHSNHSADRHYYLFRNRFYFNKKFYKNPIRSIRNVLQTIRHIVFILLGEDDKFNKIKQLIYAVTDYNNEHMGRRCTYV